MRKDEVNIVGVVLLVFFYSYFTIFQYFMFCVCVLFCVVSCHRGMIFYCKNSIFYHSVFSSSCIPLWTFVCVVFIRNELFGSLFIFFFCCCSLHLKIKRENIVRDDKRQQCKIQRDRRFLFLKKEFDVETTKVRSLKIVSGLQCMFIPFSFMFITDLIFS